MGDLEELKGLMHTYHCQGRGVEILYDVKKSIDEDVESRMNDLDLKWLSHRISTAITLLEYKW